MEFKQNCLLVRGVDIVLSFSAITGVNCVNIRNPLEIIKKKAFKEVSNIEEVILPFSLKCIEESGFENCKKLRIIKWLVNSGINSKLTFQFNAFKNCQELDTVIFENEKIWKINKQYDIGPDIQQQDEIKKIQDELKNQQNSLNQQPDSVTKQLLEERIKRLQKELDKRCFLIKNGLNKIEEIVIEKDCFAGCSNLRVIFLLADKVIISEGAFSGCEKLTFVCFKNSDAERYAREHNIGIVNV